MHGKTLNGEAYVMKSTLSEILEVEKNARRSIAQAEEYRRSVVDDAQSVREEIIAQSLEKAAARTAEIRVRLEKRCDEKIAAVEEDSKRQLAQLEKMSLEKEQEWIEELYRRTLE